MSKRTLSICGHVIRGILVPKGREIYIGRYPMVVVKDFQKIEERANTIKSKPRR